MTVNERFLQGVPHDPRSIELYDRIASVDFDNGDYFCFDSGGAGDNGEQFMYLLDIVFEQDDNIGE